MPQPTLSIRSVKWFDAHLSQWEEFIKSSKPDNGVCGGRVKTKPGKTNRCLAHLRVEPKLLKLHVLEQDQCFEDYPLTVLSEASAYTSSPSSSSPSPSS